MRRRNLVTSAVRITLAATVDLLQPIVPNWIDVELWLIWFCPWILLLV